MISADTSQNTPPSTGSTSSTGSTRAFLGWLTICIIVSLVGGAFLSVFLHDQFVGTGGTGENILLRKGPHRLMRRCSSLIALFFLPVLIRHLAWADWKRMGFRPPGEPFRWPITARHIGIGLLAALVILAANSLILHGLGIRFASDTWTAGRWSWIPSDTLESIVKGFTEEWLFRGIVFLALAHRIGNLPAALLLNGLFAILHVILPTETAYAGTGLLTDTGNVLASSFHKLGLTDRLIGMQVLNLFLFGFFLTALVIRYKTIWLSVGFHTGGVLFKRIVGEFTAEDIAIPPTLPFGWRCDGMDSLLMAIALLLMTLFVLRPVQKSNA